MLALGGRDLRGNRSQLARTTEKRTHVDSLHKEKHRQAEGTDKYGGEYVPRVFCSSVVFIYSRHPNTEPLAVFGLYLMPVPTI
jgi:hypothetical protein